MSLFNRLLALVSNWSPQIVKSGNQVESQAKSLAPVAVTLRQDTENFNAADDMLDDKPLPRELAIGIFLPICVWGNFVFLLGKRLLPWHFFRPR